MRGTTEEATRHAGQHVPSRPSRRRTEGLALVELMTVVCATFTAGLAVSRIDFKEASKLELLVGLTSAAALSIASAKGFWIGWRYVARRFGATGQVSSSREKMELNLAYLGFFVWATISGLVAYQMTGILVHLVR